MLIHDKNLYKSKKMLLFSQVKTTLDYIKLTNWWWKLTCFVRGRKPKTMILMSLPAKYKKIILFLKLPPVTKSRHCSFCKQTRQPGQKILAIAIKWVYTSTFYLNKKSSPSDCIVSFPFYYFYFFPIQTMYQSMRSCFKSLCLWLTKFFVLMCLTCLSIL